MSEHYGICKNCGGNGEVMDKCPVLHTALLKECGWCDGSGFDSSARAFLEREADRYPPEPIPFEPSGAW